MRLVLLGPYPPYRGGIAHFAASLRRELASRGHDVWALTFTRQYPRLLFPGTSELEPKAVDGALPALRVLDSINPVSWTRTGRRIRNIAPEAVIYSFWHPFFAPAYGRVRRRAGGGHKHVALVHNVLPHERKPGDAFLARRFLRGCDGVLTMSESVEAQVRKLASHVSVRRVAHPVYDIFGAAPSQADARKALGIPSDARVGLFFGFVRPYKGLDVLIGALKEIVESLPDFRLIIAGEFYEHVASYLASMDASGVSGNVIVHDRYIASDDVGRYFAAADVVIQPYVSATQSGVAPIAFQYGRPLIVTAVGGLPEVVPHGEAGLIVPPNDPRALADAVIRFFQEEMAATLSSGALRQREKLGWTPLIETLEEMIGVDK